VHEQQIGLDSSHGYPDDTPCTEEQLNHQCVV